MSTSPSLFDLNRLADYALEADELLPLVQTLEGDLSRTLDELNQAPPQAFVEMLQGIYERRRSTLH